MPPCFYFYFYFIYLNILFLTKKNKESQNLDQVGPVWLAMKKSRVEKVVYTNDATKHTHTHTHTSLGELLNKFVCRSVDLDLLVCG